MICSSISFVELVSIKLEIHFNVATVPVTKTEAATVDFIIDGTTFTIQSADLVAMVAGSANPHDKADVLDLINNADDGTGPPPNPLSLSADVYFDNNDNLYCWH